MPQCFLFVDKLSQASFKLGLKSPLLSETSPQGISETVVTAYTALPPATYMHKTLDM